MKEKKKKIQYFDYSLLIVILFLVCFGLVMLYSSSYYSAYKKFDDSSMYLKKQMFISAVSIVLMWIVSRCDYRIFYNCAKYIYYISFIIMFAVLIPGVGIEAYGARRWIKIPLFGQMQASEAAKIAIILFLPVVLCKMGEKINTRSGLFYALKWGILQSIVIWKITDNLSTAIIVMGITCTMIYIVRKETKKPLAAVGGLVAFALVFQQIMKKILGKTLEFDNFRLRRIMVWINPELYEKSGGFQVMQGLYAIGSGGLFGKGLGNGVQKMIIPEPQNDMILAIIAEELGIFGVIVVLTLFGILLYRLMFIAQNAPDKYSSLIVTGIFAHIAIQVILNVCVVLNVIPTTGITLPFISYGGTATVFLMAEMGIALGISGKIKIGE